MSPPLSLLTLPAGAGAFVTWVGAETDETHIARALFTQPIDREPSAHVHYDTHVDWASVADNLPIEDGAQ